MVFDFSLCFFLKGFSSFLFFIKAFYVVQLLFLFLSKVF